MSLRDAALFKPALIGGHRQLTDVYLLGLAVKMGGRLVTFDRRQDDRMMAVTVSGLETNAPELGQPRLVFEGRYKFDSSTAAAFPNYDVARDGRFLMIERPDDALVVVQDWFQELERLVPMR